MQAKLLPHNYLNNYDIIENQGKRGSCLKAAAVPLLQGDLDAVVLERKGNKCLALFGF